MVGSKSQNENRICRIMKMKSSGFEFFREEWAE